MRVFSKVRQLRPLLVLALVLPGCNGAGPGGDIRVPIERQDALEPAQAAGGSIELPGQRGFNIHIKKSQRDPGAAGIAKSDCDATADGQAFCSAEAANGGSSTADFTLGHRITNRTGSAQSVRIQLDYQFSQSAEAPLDAKARTLGTAQMDLVIIDSQKRSVAKMTVVQGTSDEANATVSSRDQRALTVRFEPDRWYDIMLIGMVEASADEGQQALARLDVKGLTMGLTFAPAATQPAGPGS